MSKSINETSPTISTSDSLLAGPSDFRQSITLSAPVANRYTVTFQRAAVLDAGLTIQPGQNPVTLTKADFG